ncbi:MAG: hypothetical protein ABIE43_03165 [Patescibacteria group bacterium]
MEKNCYKERLTKFIIVSDLSDNQKKLWQLFLKTSNPLEDEAVFEAASENKENLSLLSEHLRDKIWEMKELNKKAWKKLVDDEEKYAEVLK